jgi:hypothetical protein
MCKKASNTNDSEKSPEYMKASARLFAREAIEMVYISGLKICQGCETAVDDLIEKLRSLNMAEVMKDNLKDMDTVVAEMAK